MPIAIGIGVPWATLMSTGKDATCFNQALHAGALPLDLSWRRGSAAPPRVQGAAVFMTSSNDGVPAGRIISSTTRFA